MGVRPFSINIKKKNYPHAFQLRLFSSDILSYAQIFILKEYQFITNGMPEVIVDAGANIGLASIYFANQYPTAKIISIEPEQSNFACLQKNTAHYPNIIPVQAALWHENQEIYVTDPGFGKWAFITKSKNTSKSHFSKIRHTIKGVTLDTLMQEHCLEKIDILKLDIEGAEKEVLSNASAWLGGVTALIIELHERLKPGCNRSFQSISTDFDHQWKRGENIYLVRGDFLRPSANSILSSIFHHSTTGKPT